MSHSQEQVILALSMGVGGVTPHYTHAGKAHASFRYSILKSGVISLYGRNLKRFSYKMKEI